MLSPLSDCCAIITLPLDSSESRDPEYCDIPPLLPAKKGSTVQDESSDTPPPLPAKRGSITTSHAGDFTLGGGKILPLRHLSNVHELLFFTIKLSGKIIFPILVVLSSVSFNDVLISKTLMTYS